MITTYGVFILLTFLSLASIITAEVEAGHSLRPRKDIHLKGVEVSQFEADIADSADQDNVATGILPLQHRPSLKSSAWRYVDASLASSVIQNLELKASLSTRESFTPARNVSASTTIGALAEIFSGKECRRALRVGFLFLMGVVIFELEHKRSSQVDFTTKFSGFNDAQEECAHGIGPFWGSVQLWRDYAVRDMKYAVVCVAIIVTLTVLHSYAMLLMVMWIRAFWDEVTLWADSKGEDNTPKLYALLMEFIFFGFLCVASEIYSNYVATMLNLRARSLITQKYTSRWLANFAHYHMLFPDPAYIGARNPDQRIQDDIANFVERSLNLGVNLFSRSMQFCVMARVLYNISPEYVLGIEGVRCPGWLLWACLLFSAAATLVVHMVAWRMEPIFYCYQRAEADFRWELGNARRHSEQIALARGEELQQERAQTSFEFIRRCLWEKMIVRKHYELLSIGFNQIEMMLCMAFLGPPFLKGQVTLGIVMTAQKAINQVCNGTLFFMKEYPHILNLRASAARLVQFGETMKYQSKNYKHYIQTESNAACLECIACRDLTIWCPAEGDHYDEEFGECPAPSKASFFEVQFGRPKRTHKAVLFEKLDFAVLPGQKVLLSGPAGTGKTSLLRTLVGAWPFVEGHVTHREGDTRWMCFPSEVYLPQGALRSVVAYPLLSQNVLDEDIEGALRDVGLAFLLRRGLDWEEDWGKALSDGQKARISFARLILLKPKFAAMDEPFAHLDITSQAQVLVAVANALTVDASLLIVHHGQSLETNAFFNVRYRVDAERKTIVSMD